MLPNRLTDERHSIIIRRELVKLLITRSLLLAFSVFRAQPVSFRSTCTYLSIPLDRALNEKGGNILEEGVAPNRANDSRKIVPPVLRERHLENLNVTLKRTALRRRGTLKQTANDQEMPNAEIICHSMYSRHETCRRQIKFQFISWTKILIDIFE